MTTGSFNDPSGDGNPFGQSPVVLKIRRVVKEIVGTVVHSFPLCRGHLPERGTAPHTRAPPRRTSPGSPPPATAPGWPRPVCVGAVAARTPFPAAWENRSGSLLACAHRAPWYKWQPPRPSVWHLGGGRSPAVP